MRSEEPDRVVDEYLAGRMTRRQLVARLMALGAAATGASRVARGAQADYSAAATAWQGRGQCIVCADNAAPRRRRSASGMMSSFGQ